MLELQAARTITELRDCESSLHCIVEGVEKDQILVRFTHTNPFDIHRESSLALDVSSRVYKGVLLPDFVDHYCVTSI
jgi:kinetochore protein Spc25